MIKSNQTTSTPWCAHPLEADWQRRSSVAQLLRPLSWVFCLLVKARRHAYHSGLLISQSLPVPVIVVGNLNLGGTGKTPLVIWLAHYLTEQGYHPGIMTRGYLGRARRWPQAVYPDSDPIQVGDEAVLLARRTGCPVIAGPERVMSGQLLVDDYHCDILLSDDGLQHYALNRDREIIVVDGDRRLGNGLCLPAGPLREAATRLHEADLVVVNGPSAEDTLGLDLYGDQAISLQDSQTIWPLKAFRGREVAAVAGIGYPERFFKLLRGFDLRLREMPFPDHHAFCPEDLAAVAGMPVLMTEKDAVKCAAFVRSNGWYVPVDTLPVPALIERVDQLIAGLTESYGQETA